METASQMKTARSQNTQQSYEAALKQLRVFKAATPIMSNDSASSGTILPKGQSSYIWAVTDDESPLEAILENQVLGEYHGYPLEMNDPFREVVLKRWKESECQTPLT